MWLWCSAGAPTPWVPPMWQKGLSPPNPPPIAPGSAHPSYSSLLQRHPSYPTAHRRGTAGLWGCGVPRRCPAVGGAVGGSGGVLGTRGCVCHGGDLQRAVLGAVQCCWSMLGLGELLSEHVRLSMRLMIRTVPSGLKIH